MMSEFDCDYCGQFGMCEYTVVTKDDTTVELCEDCAVGAMRDDDIASIKLGFTVTK